MTVAITSFHAEYRFLSNFFPIEVVLDGLVYPSVEHAYQAAKTRDLEQRRAIQSCQTAGQAKAAGRRVDIRPNWPQMRLPIMKELLTQKFRHEGLRAMLVATGEADLIEGNTWGDRFWGVCEGTGDNHLGKLLMEVRTKLSHAAKPINPNDRSDTHD